MADKERADQVAQEGPFVGDRAAVCEGAAVDEGAGLTPDADHEVLSGESKTPFVAPAADDPDRFAKVMDAARAGSQEAIEIIIRDYLVHLKHVIRRVYRYRNRARWGSGYSSHFQETVCDILHDVPEFKGKTEEEFQAWALAIAKNNAIDAERRLARIIGDFVRLESVEEELTAAETPAEIVEKRELTSRVAAATELLSKPAQQVIELRFHEGLRFEEIGRRLHCSAKAAQKMCERALTKLRRQVKHE